MGKKFQILYSNIVDELKKRYVQENDLFFNIISFRNATRFVKLRKLKFFLK